MNRSGREFILWVVVTRAAAPYGVGWGISSAAAGAVHLRRPHPAEE